MRPARFATSAAVLVLSIASAWAQSRPAADLRTVAMDHLESKGVTAWIAASAAGERELWVARVGSEPKVRSRDPRLRDVTLDPSGRGAFLIQGDETASVISYAVLDSQDTPRVVVPELGRAEVPMHRAGDGAIVVGEDDVMDLPGTGEPQTLLHRDDPAVTSVVRNEKRSMLATVHRGRVEIVRPDGTLVGSLGAGRGVVFVDDEVVAFVRDVPGAGPSEERRCEIVLADVATLSVRPAPLIRLAGEIFALRSASERSLLFGHVGGGARRFWLLHLDTNVVRPMDLKERGTLRVAASASRPASTIQTLPRSGATPEPETEGSGFFLTDGAGGEARTAYEESGFDDARNPDEAAIHRRLVAKFLEGVQWPFRRSGAYQSFFWSDDEPFRAGSTVPHLGLDVGARLMHISTGSVAFHAPGTAVRPIYRGGRLWFGQEGAIRDLPPSENRKVFRIVQEVEIKEGDYLLRVHIDYSHVHPRPAETLGGKLPDGPIAVTGDEVIGDLESYNDASPAGGWTTSAESLRAAGVEKGNHIHLGTGGLWRSFNGSAENAQRKLRWYQDAFLPALLRSPGPR